MARIYTPSLDTRRKIRHASSTWYVNVSYRKTLRVSNSFADFRSEIPN